MLHCEIKDKKVQSQYRLYEACVLLSLISGAAVDEAGGAEPDSDLWRGRGRLELRPACDVRQGPLDGARSPQASGLGSGSAATRPPRSQCNWNQLGVRSPPKAPDVHEHSGAFGESFPSCVFKGWSDVQ
eukprot:2274524-Rhodomonas_salina.1